jgi:hypothetical protein
MNPTPITAVGRYELESLLRTAEREIAKLREERDAATKKIDADALLVECQRRRITELQARGNELLEDARASKRQVEGLRIALDMHPLADLLVALQKGRAKYPAGVTLLSVLDEAGELAHAANKGESEERQRAEALDTARISPPPGMNVRVRPTSSPGVWPTGPSRSITSIAPYVFPACPSSVATTLMNGERTGTPMG